MLSTKEHTEEFRTGTTRHFRLIQSRSDTCSRLAPWQQLLNLHLVSVNYQNVT